MNNYIEKHQMVLRNIPKHRISHAQQNVTFRDNRSYISSQNALIHSIQTKLPSTIQRIITPDLTNKVSLTKGTCPISSKWQLFGSEMGNAHSVHHIINFDSSLLPWFEDMSAAYNYTRTPTQNKTQKNRFNEARGRIKKILNSVGVKLDHSGDISGSQPSFSWRSGNLFIGIASDYRIDDPGSKNEWESTNTLNGSEINSYITEGRSVYEEMMRTRNKISDIFNSDFDNSETLKSKITKSNCYITDSFRNWFENKDWTCNNKIYWGSKFKLYKLRNDAPKTSLESEPDTIFYTNRDYGIANHRYYWGDFSGNIFKKINKWDNETIKDIIITEHLIAPNATIEADKDYNLDEKRHTAKDDPEVGYKLGVPFRVSIEK